MLILGLSSFKHDTAAALLENGTAKAAIENDKLVRSRTVGLPESAIRFCLDMAGVRWDDLDAIAVATRPFRGWTRRSLLRAGLSPFSPVSAAYHEAIELGGVARELHQVRTLQRDSGRSNILHFEHHLCHASNAFYLSPYDRALILTLDREGDGHSGMVAVGEGTSIRVLRTIPFPHSLAWIYAQVTDLLGFLPHHDRTRPSGSAWKASRSSRTCFLTCCAIPRITCPA